MPLNFVSLSVCKSVCKCVSKLYMSLECERVLSVFVCVSLSL